MPFTTPLTVTDHTEHEWVLVKPLEYQGRFEQFIVDAGFVTDFASVPRSLWVAFPPYGKYTKAAVVHDKLYRTHEVSRADADGIFRRMMRELGVSAWRRYMMWAAVRVGGRRGWRRRR